jgi:NAD(P)-dependent dehydrogenase (short-subunit alcohol dehydrogenase family)
VNAKSTKNSGTIEYRQKVAIITGGAGAGIGHGITLELVADGWAVMIVDLDEAGGRCLADRLRAEGKAAQFLALDITAAGVPELVVTETIRIFGRLDGLVNNAGVGNSQTIEMVTEEEVARVFSVDFLAALRFTKAASSELRKAHGAVVNIGSVHAHFAHPSYVVYASAKAALGALTRATAIESGVYGVRANCIHPGLVESPQNFALIQQFTNGHASEWLGRYLQTRQCIPEPVTPSQVGALAAYLLSDKAATLTGQSIFLDGGTTTMLWDKEQT